MVLLDGTKTVHGSTKIKGAEGALETPFVSQKLKNVVRKNPLHMGPRWIISGSLNGNNRAIGIGPTISAVCRRICCIHKNSLLV